MRRRSPRELDEHLRSRTLQANLYAAFWIAAWQQIGNGALTGVLFWNWDPNAAEVGPGNGDESQPAGAAGATRPPRPSPGFVRINAVTTARMTTTATRTSDIAWRDTAAEYLALADERRVGRLERGRFGQDAHVAGRWSDSATSTATAKPTWLWRDGSRQPRRLVHERHGQVSSAASQSAPLPTAWSIAATGDFDGDGDGDILWRDTGGNLAIWLMNGTAVRVFRGPRPRSRSPGRSPARRLQRRPHERHSVARQSSGNLAIWFMNGTRVVSSAAVGDLPPAWAIIGTGDFNGDGTERPAVAGRRRRHAAVVHERRAGCARLPRSAMVPTALVGSARQATTTATA